MSIINLYKNSEEISYVTGTLIEISDRDFLNLEITCEEDLDIEVYLEDYKLPLIYSTTKKLFYTKEDRIFRESFGYSNLRVFINGEIYKDFAFKIKTNMEKFNHITNMVLFLLKNNDRVLDICLSRTKYKLGIQHTGAATFETVISTAEEIIEFLQIKSLHFKSILRKRLMLHKEEKNEFNLSNIDPYEIINNIDNLYYNRDEDSLKIKGKSYSLNNIKRNNYIESYDVEENRVILGGLISIKNILIDINSKITQDKNLEYISYEKEYSDFRGFHSEYSIEDLYLYVTTNGMIKRIDYLLSSIEILLFDLKKKLFIKFTGFLYPNNSLHVKNSSFYKHIFEKFFYWYNLGEPSLGANENLIKIRSASKIYEIYCLYKFIDLLYTNGWVVTRQKEHDFFKNFIPSEIEFQKNHYSLKLLYDKTIYPFSKETKNNELVYLDHNKKSNYRYYTPDFIIKVKDLKKEVRYFIFDAKYSDISTLARFNVLDKLYKKYFTNLAVFNEENKSFTSTQIYSVIALHPFGKNQLTKWHKIKGFIIFPMIESCQLSFESNFLEDYIKYFEFD